MTFRTKSIKVMETNKGQLEIFNYLSKGNQFVLYVFKRISKVSQAVYIITDIIKDTEPLKWTLRSVASEMVSLKHFLNESDVFYHLERMLLELEGLLDFARHTKVLSDMNVAVLQDQIKCVVSEIKEGEQSVAYPSKLGQSFFDVARPAATLPKLPSDPDKINTQKQHKSHKGHNVLYDFYVGDPQKVKLGKPSNDASPDKGHRREDVLKIIRDKGAVTIKDITEQVKSWSEKTVQRELTAMVVQGVIKKTGERRWSRYSAV